MTGTAIVELVGVLLLLYCFARMAWPEAKRHGVFRSDGRPVHVRYRDERVKP